MSYPAQIAIIVPVHNRLQITKQGISCIYESIEFYRTNSSDPYKITLVVVDDGSTDGSGDWIKKRFPEIIVLTGNGNLWWTGAINMGIDYFKKNFNDPFAIILQNDDIVIEKEWLFNLLQAASVHDDALIGCATSTLNEKESIYYGGIAVHPWLSRTTSLNKGQLRKAFKKGHMEESFDLYGRGLFIPMSVLEQTGPFNANRFRHRGDMDIPLRARKLGYKLLVCYDAIVFQLPELTYGADTSKNMSLKDVFNLLTDFRSSTSISTNFYYSLQATKNNIQFLVFFSFRTLFAVKSILSRYFKQKYQANVL